MYCVLLTTIHMSTRPEGFLDLDKILLVFVTEYLISTNSLKVKCISQNI